MNKTKTKTFYSVAVGAACLLMLFAAGCGGSGSDDCGENEIDIDQYGCLTECTPGQGTACAANETCRNIDDGGGACVPDDDNGGDPDTGPDDTGVDGGDDPVDGGMDDDGGDQDMGTEDDVEEDGGDNPPDRPRSSLTCFETLFCLQLKCFGQDNISDCFTKQRQAADSEAQNNFANIDQCRLGLTVETTTCGTACGENGSDSQCETCTQNNCPDAADACFSSAPPAETQTCGDAFQCVQGCSVQTDTESGFQSCLQDSCPTLLSEGSEQAQKLINMQECIGNNSGFGRGDNEGPDAGIGTNDAGMQVSTCSTQADQNGNNNAQIDTEGEQTEETSCIYDACGDLIDSCLGCR